MTAREVQVHVDLADGPTLAGTLFLRVVRGRESATFRYADGWLAHPDRFALDPTRLPLGPDAFTSASNEPLFPALADSAPDRWGRVLMERAERLSGSKRTLFGSDFLLRVHDRARQGALRFRDAAGGPFLADGPPIPPLVRLAELLTASDRVQEDDGGDDSALRLLLAPGSSLGGARPKAGVLDANGRLSIAKFPSHHDPWPVIPWEWAATTLAARAGITVSPGRLVPVAGRSVLVVERFDRWGERRVPFLSALALLGARDREDHSYLEVADAIRRHGSAVRRDLRELWRRIVFHVLISNTDDHLRNHGFLWDGAGWGLAPAFDLNPVPVDVKARVHALALDDRDPRASLDTVRATAPWFGLSDREAAEVVREVGAAVATWRVVAAAAGLSPAQVERMASAFEHDDLRAALTSP